MRRLLVIVLGISAVFALTNICPGSTQGSIVAWGNNDYNQVDPPEGYDFIAIDAGHLHSLALRRDGSIVGWGNSSWGEAEPPADSNFVAIAAGWDHSLGLRRDGSIVGWGRNHWGQITPPDGNDFVAIAGGGYHSLALRKNGKVVGWGGNEYGQGGPPPGDSNDFVAISAGWSHSLALKKNGSIVAWGSNQDWSGNWWGQATIPPDGNDYIAIDAGCFHSLALKKDGSIVGWGCNFDGRAGPPPGDGNDFIAIIAGQTHNLALKKDGSIVGWGTNVDWHGNWVGQAIPPDGNDFVAISAGGYHSLAIKKAIPLNETHSTESQLLETLVYKQASSDDITVTGDVNGTVVLNDFEIVTIQTGPFTGEGFSIGNFESTLEGAVYTGEWKGVVFLKPQERRIYLKGSAVGEILATVEGYLTESVPDSNIYDQYEATWKIGRLGTTTTSATINLNGTLSYQSSSEFPATQLYILQSSIEGILLGHYAGSLSSVINHVRIADGNNPYFGEGFSIISYVSVSGQGQGWTYDKLTSPGIVEMKGLFDSPLFGIVSATLDEREIPRTLFVTIERIDLGLPPMADLEVKIWGPGSVSPGQTVNYIIEYRNDGLKSADYISVGVEIPEFLEYVTSSEGGIYFAPESPGRELWFEDDIKPKTKDYKTVTFRFPWGLTEGTKANLTAFIGTTITEIKDGFCPRSDEIVPGFTAPDLGPDGSWEGVPIITFTETRIRIRTYPLKPIVEENGDGTCNVTYRCRTWIEHQERKVHMVYNPWAFGGIGGWVSKSCEDWSFVDQQGSMNEVTRTFECQGLPLDPDTCPNKNIFETQISAARDPSVKYGPEGQVLPGEKLNYMVEYENEGEGIAFGVYFTDTLDEDLNDSTLEIGPVIDVNSEVQIAPPGIYNPSTRTITWFAGQVDPNQGGYADFNVCVLNDANEGTEIINYATVYFPSGPEETRTNGIVSIVCPNEPPAVGVVFPGSEAELEGLVTLIADANDNGEVVQVYFYLREPNDGNGVPIGYEDLSADFNDTSGKWEYNLYSTHVSNGDYVILAQAVDGCGNVGYSELVPVTIYNRPPGVISVNKCSVTAGSKANSDKISISGNMDATADDFNGVSVIEVTVDSNDMVNPCVQTFPINETTFKKGKYKCSKTEDSSKTSFTFDTKTSKFSFTAKNVDLSGLGCSLTIEIEIGDYTGAAEVNEAIVNGKKPIPIKLMKGVKNSLRVDKIQIQLGKRLNSHRWSVKGGFAVEDPNVSMAYRISEGLVITSGTQKFTIPATELKAGKDKFTFKNAHIVEGGLATGEFNFKTCRFMITIKNITIEAGSGAANFSVEFADFSEGVNVVLP